MNTQFSNKSVSCSSTSGADAGQGALGFFSRYSGGGRSPRKSPCASPRISEQGSALLIVLGFLSFMMISAVSFAVYMRIERQASSNYRHATAARHMLNAGLYRAIDDIDAELRVPSVSGTARPRKFPDWPGRVKVSAVPNGEDNVRDARVLSLEALSFIPGILVNDVRRYAVPNTGDPGTWWGAKWRTITMPNSVAGGAEVDVGRYAYVCINVSDFFDVNVCRAVERDSGSNRVSIAHLFTSDGFRDTFESNFKNTDKHYDTLQDFYACMYKRNDPTFGSPYHRYLNSGNSANADVGFDDAGNHILVTDSIAKAEPTANAQPCNILSKTGEPIAAGTLMQAQPASVALQPEFQTAIGNALAGHLVSGATAGGDMTAAMIADYIDEDGIPKRLNMPCVEMTPMISQILVPSFMAPIVKKRSVDVPGATPARKKEIYSLQLVGEPSAMMMDIELVWPFKNQKDRTKQPSFTVEVQAYLKVIKKHEPKKSQSFPESPTLPNYVPLTGSVPAPDFWSKDTSDPLNCYAHVPVILNTPDPKNLLVDMIDSEDGVIPGSGFVEGQPFSVALVVFVNVKSGSDIVDRVPQMMPFLGSGGLSWNDEFMVTPKIFFQTEGTRTVEKTMITDVPSRIKYEWSNLEVPDPRFNYKAANWIQSKEAGDTIKPLINPSTLALLGKEGRDGDIYMAVSDVGSLQSPGELGFIVRPFPQKLIGKNADFREQLTIDNSEDNEAMFRTLRLYDHGDPSDAIKCAHDRIYENFTARNPNGTVAGARVNPLSDLPPVLAAAAASTPVDYYWAGAKLLTGGRPTPSTVRKYVFEKTLGNSSWASFTNAWTKCLINAKNGSQLNTSWKNNLSDVYGSQVYFGWYSQGNVDSVFNGGYSAAGVPATLSTPLQEIDRKMLYSFTLDSFSDRQQLFLYILRAESTVPDFGGSTEGGVKSLAGGRAVALVWRDPYPTGYNKANNTFDQKDWYTVGNSSVSPWYQYNLNRYDTSREEGEEDGTFPQRLDGFHETKILYFKQLDN
jgi:hypothetical protein